MATIKELTYIAWKILDGREPTDDSRYSYRQIRAVIEGAIADALKRDFYERRAADGDVLYPSDTMSTLYENLPVQTDTHSGLKYITIPDKAVSIPADRTIDITPANRVSLWEVEYIPVRQSEVFLAKKQRPIPCVILYYINDNKVTFFNGVVNEESLDVTRWYSLPQSDTADIKMPEEFKNLVIQQALQTLNPQLRPVDHANEGTEN